MPYPLSETVDSDTRIADTPVYLHSVTLLTSAGGAGVSIYDDNHANSERSLLFLESANNVAKTHSFHPPLPCHRGLYLDLSSNCDYVTVVYTIASRESV